MNCQEFQDRWQELLDERLPLNAELQAHLELCAGCHTDVELWSKIESVLPARIQPPLPLLVAESKLPSEDRGDYAAANTTGRGRAWVPCVAMAALLLISFSFWQPSPAPTTMSVFRPDEFSELYSSASDRFKSLHQTTTASVKHAVAAVQQPMLPKMELVPGLDLEPLQKIPGELKPIPDRIAKAFDFLWTL